jgi:uncharacterized protein (DUF1501 family)
MALTRRTFLSRSAGVVSLSSGLPGLWQSAAAMHREDRGDKILVVLQLSGGNDGLNTIVPYRDHDYRRARPTLGISAADVLKLSDELGLHPAMSGFSKLFDAGKLAVLQGIGYPHPNRSHFESMDIWHTCRRKSEHRESGWLGRFLDAGSTPGGDAPAIHLGDEPQPLALAAERIRVPSIRSLERFRLQEGRAKELAATISNLASAERPGEQDLISFVQSSTTSALEASRRVDQAMGNYKPAVSYPVSRLAEKLKVIAQLIDSGLRTRIYYVALDGFDTHSQQPEAHAGLLQELSAAIAAFVSDTAAHGHGRRVLVMGFSEFGRRVAENASSGTDHGAAGPMFLAGERVQPGLIGRHPSIAPPELTDGDLRHHTDFRQIYASVLEQWFEWESEPILGGRYQLLDLIAGATGEREPAVAR